MKRYDYVIIVLVVAIAIGSLGVLKIKKTGEYSIKYVEISSENKLYKRIPLGNNTNEKIIIKNKLGMNEIEIVNGIVRIHDADCPDKICIKDGAIREPGDPPLVCLPNKVVVEIKGENTREIDENAY